MIPVERAPTAEEARKSALSKPNGPHNWYEFVAVACPDAERLFREALIADRRTLENGTIG